MTTYKLNNTTNSLLLKTEVEKPKELDKKCFTCDRMCSMFCNNRCGSWACPNKHEFYFDKEGNKHLGHYPMCGYEEDEIDCLNEDIKSLIKTLKTYGGHTCIIELETNPIKFKWCEKSKCVNSK